MIDRRIGIGATEIAAILRKSMYRSELQVWLGKMSDVPVTIEDNFRMKIGRKLEKTVVELWEEETGKKATQEGLLDDKGEPKPIFDKKYAFLFCHPDRVVVGENAGLEIKTTSENNWRAWDGEEIPVDYYYQCMGQMMIMGWDKTYLVCLLGNKELVKKEIMRDDEMIKRIKKELVAWWKKHVIGKTKPEHILAMDTETIKALYPEVKQPVIIETTDDKYQRICETLEGNKADFALLKMAIDQAENELKDLIGTNDGVKINGIYEATWKQVKGKGTDTERMASEAPEELNDYLSAIADAKAIHDKYPTKERKFKLTNLTEKKKEK